MEKCLVIKNLSPEIFVKLMVLVLYWQYWPPKIEQTTSVFKWGTITIMGLVKILDLLNLISKDQIKIICSSSNGIDYRTTMQRYSGIYTNGSQVVNNCSWLICRQKGNTLQLSPRSFIRHRRFELTELGAEKALSFEKLFEEYGLRKKICLEVISQV